MGLGGGGLLSGRGNASKFYIINTGAIGRIKGLPTVNRIYASAQKR